MTGTDAPRVAVAGADHLHLFSIVDALVRAGAQTVAHTPDGTLIEAYRGWQSHSREVSLAEILADASIDVVVTVAVPADRAAITVAALHAGKPVVSAKPGVTTRAQLAAVVEALADRPGRAWTVVFTERFENRAIAEAVRMAQAGAVGRVVRVTGTGPHSLYADQRPDWFWDPAAGGGILVDLASHQVDQFLAVLGERVDLDDPDRPDRVGVRSAAIGNVNTPEHPAFQDIGSLTLVAPGAHGEHSVDFLSPAGLGTWGDARLVVTGTAGTLEVRANIDVAGHDGAEHLIHVDAEGTRRVDLRDVTLDWAADLLADLADGGERLMTQAHVLAVSDLTLRAQELASAWGTPQEPTSREPRP